MKYANRTLHYDVIDTDNSKSKLIETFIGNPKSVLRGIKTFIGEPKDVLGNKKLAIIGFGKIGRGLARLFRDYSSIGVFDINNIVLQKASDLGFNINLITDDKSMNTVLLKDYDIIMTCTGFESVISDYFIKKDLTATLLLNIGAVDEFGPDYNEDEVFMSKNHPFNFNLVPPTENMFVDPILSAHLEGLRFLIENDLKPHKGLIKLPKIIDDLIIRKFSSNHDYNIEDIDKYFS